MAFTTLPGTQTFTRTTSDVAAWLDGLATEIKLLQTTHEGMLCGALIEEARKALASASAANRFEAQQDADDRANPRSGAIFAQEAAADHYRYVQQMIAEGRHPHAIALRQKAAAYYYAKARVLLGYESPV